jgi:hypothetical protein
MVDFVAPQHERKWQYGVQAAKIRRQVDPNLLVFPLDLLDIEV